MPPTVPPAAARTSPGRLLYVDLQLAPNSCADYSPTTRSCGGGSEIAYRDLEEASLAALAGDTVVLREGTFTTQLAPPRSGTPGAYITFRNYSDETVVFTRIERPAILLRDRTHVAIHGLTITDVLGWGRIEHSAHNIIRNNRFSKATARGTTGGLKLVKSAFNRILQNSFDEGNDSVVIQESDRNVLEGNSFTWARHSLLSIRCGSLNVVRRNRFHNMRQKAVEIYDCEAVSDAPYKLDATKRNLIEENTFAFTRGPSQPHRYNGIQYAGQLGIVRRNVFYDNHGGALRVGVYPDEALYNYGHRIYHNTFYANECYAVGGSSGGGRAFGDTLVENNLFYRNRDCEGRPVQTDIQDTRAVLLRRNAILGEGQDPMFVAEEKRDLRLRTGSAMIDAGGFLTKTIGAGAGTAMTVEDVKYFSDGFGIDGEQGDLVQLAGGSERARVVAIDYVGRRLTLDRPLAWENGQGLALAYEGQAPDLGAHEYASPQSVNPE